MHVHPGDAGQRSDHSAWLKSVVEFLTRQHRRPEWEEPHITNDYYVNKKIKSLKNSVVLPVSLRKVKKKYVKVIS